MNKHGSIIFSLLLVLVLTALGAALLVRSVNENKIANRTANSTRAFWLADAGLQKAKWEYASNHCTGMVQQGTMTACLDCACLGATKALAVSVAGIGDIDATIDSGNTTVQSTGSAPSRTNTNKITRRVQGTIGNQSPFTYAVFAKAQVTLSNNTFIDSYNSNNGVYSNGNSTTNGDVGSNGTTAGTISIGNNISLGGDVSTGTNGTATVGANTTIAGTTTHDNNVALPAVTVPSSLTGLSSSGTLSLGNGGSTTLAAGDYQYTSATLSNNSTLNITGNVRLYLTAATALTTGNNVNVTIASGGSLAVYVDGVLSIPNNVTINNVGDVPKNFQVYSTYTGSNGVSLNNNGVLSAAVYAPNTDISIGNNNDLYGSIIGKTVSVNNNSAIHYDESLGGLSTSAGPVGITAWQEI